MRAHYLQHVHFEGPGSIEPWLRNSGYEISSTKFFESSDLPDPLEVDMLVVMGGPMSVNNEQQFHWLINEKKFIRDVIRAEKPVLGVCLGAQLIADALGARVYQNDITEIGWFPVENVSSPGDEIFHFPPLADVFHWHGETFDLPPGAVLLASSKVCKNQAFQLGRSVIGLQFHLETTPQTAREIIGHCREELIPSTYVQSEDELLSISPDKYNAVNHLMAEVLSFLAPTH